MSDRCPACGEIIDRVFYEPDCSGIRTWREAVRLHNEVCPMTTDLEDMRMRLMRSPTRCCTFWLCVFGALFFFWLMSLFLNVLP